MNEVSRVRDLEHIRRRIYKNRSIEKKSRIVNAFNRLIIALMVVCVISLSVMIASKLQPHFALNAWDYIQSIQWSSFLPFETWFKGEQTQSVAAMDMYETAGEHRYLNDTNIVTAPFTAMVLHIEAQNDTYCVSLLLDDGTLVNISNMQDVSIQQDERILAGAAIGTYQEYVEIHCYIDGTEIDLKDVEA